MSRLKPQTLDELRQMSREELEEVDEYQYRGNLTIKYLIQDFVRLANEELEWRGEENTMSLRGFWYSGVKQMLENAFPEKAHDPSYKFSRRMSQNLSDVLSEMVQDGEISYRDLNILDDSRDRFVFEDTIEDDKILFVEKQAAYRQLKPLADVYELTIVSGGGWEATALIEDLAYELQNGQQYDLFVLADYDPTGFRIVEDFERRASTLGINVRRVERVGINPEQVDAETVEVERFMPPVESDYDEQWMARHGIDGRYGLEIEAIGDLQSKGEELREVVVDVLRPHISERRRRHRDLNRRTNGVVRGAADDIVEQLVQSFRRRLYEAGAEVIGDRPAVKVMEYDGEDNVFRSNVKLDAAEENDDELIPIPYGEGVLHDSAIEGEAPHAQGGAAQWNLRDALRQMIAEGEIDAEDLIDL